jgi:hypothetical protein
MELTATPCATAKPPTLREVFRRITDSVTGYCREKLFSARKTVGVTLRLERAAAHIDRLMRRFRRGELIWRKRAPRAAVQQDDKQPAARKPGLGLPCEPGWLADELPLTAIYHGPALHAAMQGEEMQALMGATPEVARTMRPIFRMFWLDEDVLKVPAGHPRAPAPVLAPELAEEERDEVHTEAHQIQSPAVEPSRDEWPLRVAAGKGAAG